MKSGKLVYRIIPPEIEIRDSLAIEKIKILEKFNEDLKEKTFSLLFNSNNSFFENEDNLINDNNDNSTIKKINYNLYSKYSYFFNLKENGCYKIDNSDSKIIIKLKNELNWKITNESKNIDGYLCYKATAIKKNSTIEEKERKILSLGFILNFHMLLDL
ncbi:GLPGLI family protein [Flavobacterium jejuense]